MDDVIGVGGVARNAVLAGLFGVGVLPLLSPLFSLGFTEPPSGSQSTSTDVVSYTTIARCHQRLYWATSTRLLYDASFAHTQLGIELMRSTHDGDRTATALSVAESAILTGRLALFDLNQTAIAERCFDIALAATREAGSHELAAVALGHMAFIPAFGRKFEDARGLIDAAMQHSWTGVGPSVRSWLHCVASEVEVRGGSRAAARRHIDLAIPRIDNDTIIPHWLDFFNATRLQAFAGYAALAAGDRNDAANHLARALDGLKPTDTKQRSVVLADLAMVHPDDGEWVASHLQQALETLRLDMYATGLARVRMARLVLGDSQHGGEVDGRLADLQAKAVLPIRSP